MVERLWRSVQFEVVYLHAYDSVADARAGLRRYFSATTPGGNFAEAIPRTRMARFMLEIRYEYVQLPDRARSGTCG